MEKKIYPSKAVTGSRRPLACAPYDVQVLRDFLQSILPFQKTARIQMRYDLDESQCLANISRLVRVNKDLGLPAKIYMRVDGVSYVPKDCRAVLVPLREQGFDIGLHTTCYVYQDDCLDAFASETKVFTEAMGFAPTTFTVHGMGEYRIDIRNNFVNGIRGNLEKYGYEHTDCGATDLIYSYVFQDCNFESSTKKRFMHDDFIRPGEFIIPGQDVLILIHPCYWDV